MQHYYISTQNNVKLKFKTKLTGIKSFAHFLDLSALFPLTRELVVDRRTGCIEDAVSGGGSLWNSSVGSNGSGGNGSTWT